MLNNDKLFREPKLNLGYVRHRPDRIPHRGLAPTIARTFLAPGQLQYPAVHDTAGARTFMIYGWPVAGHAGFLRALRASV
jgi:hypothetical protein